jgi:hypothetical protein
LAYNKAISKPLSTSRGPETSGAISQRYLVLTSPKRLTYRMMTR